MSNLTCSQAANVLGISKTTILRMVYAEEIEAEKDGRYWQFDSDYIHEFAKTYTPTPKGQYRRKAKRNEVSTFNIIAEVEDKRPILASARWLEIIARNVIRVKNNMRNPQRRIDELNSTATEYWQ